MTMPTSSHKCLSHKHPSHKRLIVCCDGTWNEPSQSPMLQHATNVFKLSQAIPACDRHGIPQIVFYARGLGTGDSLNRLLGGALGAGIDQAIQDAYLFLSMNYQPGDEVYLFGFSRGAYTVRSLAGFIYTAGLLKPEEMRCAAGVDQVDQVPTRNRLEEAYQLYRSAGITPSSEQAKRFRQQETANFQQIPIRLLCCWDTVGSLGIPDLIPASPLNDAFNRRYRFHDHRLCSKIEYALHAVALDERRAAFNVTPMESDQGHLEQMLFPGDHGCVGGGSEAKRGLSNAALQWVLDRIAALDDLHLEVDSTKLGEALDDQGRLQTDPMVQPLVRYSFGAGLLWRLLGVFKPGFKRQITALTPAAIAWLTPSPTSPSIAPFAPEAQRFVYDLHDSVKQRLQNPEMRYEPAALRHYAEAVLGLEGDRLFQDLRHRPGPDSQPNAEPVPSHSVPSHSVPSHSMGGSSPRPTVAVGANCVRPGSAA